MIEKFPNEPPISKAAVMKKAKALLLEYRDRQKEILTHGFEDDVVLEIDTPLASLVSKIDAKDKSASLVEQIQFNQISRLEIYRRSKSLLKKLGGIESLVNLLMHNSSVSQLSLYELQIRPHEANYIAELLQENTRLLEVDITVVGII
jgi:hypothetical protein